MSFGGFQSKFKQNEKLKRCAVNDQDHISMMFSPKGDHVGLIHEALNRWLINNGFGEKMINGEERDTKTFGKKTHDAVDFFKRKKNILNYAGQIDQVVGKKTVVALDKELPKEEDEKPKPDTKVAVAAWNESKPLLIAHEADNRSKGDLDSNKREPAIGFGPREEIARRNLRNMRLLQTHILEKEMRAELAGAGPAGAVMADTFIRNVVPKAVVTFQPHEAVPKLIAASSEFADAKSVFTKNMKEVLDTEIRISNTLDYRILSFRQFNRLDPPMLSFDIHTSRQLKVAIGSTQGVDVFLTNFRGDPDARRWDASLRFEYFDHFGCDDNDIIPDKKLHGSLGQVGLWIMQHERRPGHLPFVSRMIVTADVSATF